MNERLIAVGQPAKRCRRKHADGAYGEMLHPDRKKPESPALL
jgi:hypothetical protein